MTLIQQLLHLVLMVYKILTVPSVEIELARLVIRSLLVQYLSFSSTLMLSSMHHIDTHIF